MFEVPGDSAFVRMVLGSSKSLGPPQRFLKYLLMERKQENVSFCDFTPQEFLL